MTINHPGANLTGTDLPIKWELNISLTKQPHFLYAFKQSISPRDLLLPGFSRFECWLSLGRVEKQVISNGQKIPCRQNLKVNLCEAVDSSFLQSDVHKPSVSTVRISTRKGP